MTMKKTLDTVLKRTGWTRYKLAKEIGVTTQALDHMLLRDAKGVRVAVLCKLKEASGMTWEQFGKLLEREHIDRDSD